MPGATSIPAPILPRAAPLRRHARVAARAAAYWLLAAAIAAVTLADRRWAAQSRERDSQRPETVTRAELAERAVLRALRGARADLHLLAAMGVVGGYVRDPDPARRAALARDLFAFMATRGWCSRVSVIAGASRVGAERQPGPGRCDTFAGLAAGFPASEALLAVVEDEDEPRLCLGLPLGPNGSGVTAALVAEVEPRDLLADLPLGATGAAGVALRDAQGQWLLAPAAGPGVLELRPVRLSGWSGPAAGTWQLALRAGAEPGDPRAPLPGAPVTLLLVVASAAAALALARAGEARREAEAAARAQLALFQRVSDNVPVPIYLKDADGRYVGCNTAFETLLGRSREAIVGRTVRELLPPGTSEPHEESDRAVLADGESRRYASQLKGADGRVRELLISKSAVRDELGRPAGVTAALLDVTELKAQQRELSRSVEALAAAKEAALAGTRAKAEFLAMMSHEMRTPLHAVIGATSLLLDAPLAPEQRGHAETARQAAQALLDLIDDLLEFSRLEAGRLDLERVDFDLHALARETVALTAGRATAKGLELVCEVADELPARVSGDPGRLRQVLLSLLSNAIEFTERGTVRASLALAGRCEQGLLLRLSVTDTGPGIPSERLPNLFEPFARGENRDGDRGGAGLGLAMSRRLVELMGGTIEAASTPGSGSVFTCCVPLGDAAAAEPATGAPPERPRRGLEVLVVEDNRVNQRVSAALLARFGCVVELACDGREALDKLERHRYDLVFMDCAMPVMSGYEATREIRRREAGGPRVPIVALTAHALRGDRERCLAAGMDDYLAKPVDAAALERMLARYGGSDGTAPRPEAPTAPAGAGAILDPGALATLRSLEKDGPGFLSTLVREFDEGFQQRFGDMQCAARDQDGATLRGAAHTLKGSAGIFGAGGMVELCRRIEHLAEEGAVADAAPLISRLAHEHEAVMSVLREAAVPA